MYAATSRTGREQQVYNDGSRMVAGCLPINPATRKVLMISSSKHEGKWVFPKGGWENNESQEEAAIRETWEESGAIGKIISSLGEFHTKIDKRTGIPETSFMFYEMHVAKLEDKWPESKSRERRWFTYDEAMEASSKKFMREALQRSSLAPK